MNNKLAIISRSFAPLVIGSPILLDNLLSNYPGEYEVIAGWQYGAKTDPKFLPRAKTNYLKIPIPIFQRIFDRFIFYFIPIIKFFIELHIKRIKPRAILGVFPSAEYFVSGFQIAKKYGIPFMVHMHDLWEENISSDDTRKKDFAVEWEKVIFEEASIIYCMTSVQAEHYEKKYGIKTKLMPHSIQSKFLYNKTVFNTKKINRKEKTVIYSGNISHMMNLDAVQQFVKAVNFLPDNYQVKIFTSFNKQIIKKLKLYNENIIYDWLSMDDMKKEISQSDLLFLPLSHKNGAAHEVRTVFATKILDYLVSGTPILVFSPKNSFHSISAKKGKWGYVVDIDEPKAISDAIINVTNSNEISHELVNNAYKEALSRNADTFSEKLYNNVLSSTKNQTL